MKSILVTSKDLKKNNWEAIENLLVENQVQAIFNDSSRAMTAEEICSVCSKTKIEGIVVYSSSDEINSEVFKNCKDLKVISRHGVGIENIDITVAKKYGVEIRTTNELCDYETVADLAFGLILCLSRRIALMDRSLKKKIGFEKWVMMFGVRN